MKIGRRKFLSLVGLSPIAAKAATDELVLKEVLSTGSYGMPAPPSLQGAVSADASSEPYWLKPLRWLQKNKLPDWTLDQIREDTRHVAFLDPDIAAKRSWSPAVKIAEQRERNFRRRVQLTMKGPELSAMRNAFHEKTGIYI